MGGTFALREETTVSQLTAESIKEAHDRLRILGSPILDAPWEPDDLGKILFQLAGLQASHIGPREQQIASSLIRAAESLLQKNETHAEEEMRREDIPSESFRSDEVIEGIEGSILDFATHMATDASSQNPSQEFPVIDHNRGALWNRIAWALEPLHEASDERFWLIASSRIGLYGGAETLDSIGTYLGITRERTRQLELKIHHLIREPGENAWSEEWMNRSMILFSADRSGFAMWFDEAIEFGHHSSGDPDVLFPQIGELLFRHEAIQDAAELELWARCKSWLDLDGHSELLSDAYRRLSRGDRRAMVVPGAEALERAAKLSREQLRHNGAADIEKVAAVANVPETALLLSLGRDASVTHVPGTSWVASLGNSQGSLHTRIGKLLSHSGPLDAEEIAICLAKARPGRADFATNLPVHVVASILDLTPGIEREVGKTTQATRWLWTAAPISLGEVSEAILRALSALPSPFSRLDAYQACSSIPQGSVDVFIAGPFCVKEGRDAHALIGERKL